MRSAAFVFIKMLGLLVCYWTIYQLISFLSLVISLGMRGRADVFSYFGLGLMAITSATMVWFLLWRTELLLDTIGIKNNEIQEPWIGNGVLSVGVKLVGLYVLALSIPQLLAQACGALWVNSITNTYWVGFLSALLRVVFGSILIFRTGRVLTLIGSGVPDELSKKV